MGRSDQQWQAAAMGLREKDGDAVEVRFMAKGAAVAYEGPVPGFLAPEQVMIHAFYMKLRDLFMEKKP